MANGKIRFGKQSGGELALVIPDGITSTDLVLPESGTVATEAYANGKTTLTQVKAEISTGSNRVTSSTGTIGYGAGSGGTVTQLTSKSTYVTLNKPTGKITMNNAALAAGASVEFIINNSLVSGTDTIITSFYPSLGNVATNYKITTFTYNSQIGITLKNDFSSSLSQAVEFTFTVIKGAHS